MPKRRLRPHTPLYNPKKQVGSINVGNTPPVTTVPPTVDFGFVDSVSVVLPFGIALDGDHLYVAHSNGSSLASIDVSDPTNMVLDDVFTASSATGASDVVVIGSVAYLAGTKSGDDTIVAVDISDPTNLTELDELTLTGQGLGYSLTAIGTDVFATNAQTTGPVTSIDASTPSSLSIRDTVNVTFPYGIRRRASTLFAISYGTGAIVSINASDPTNLSVIQTLDITHGEADGMMGIAISGNYAYIASYGTDSLGIVDISDPADMAEVASVTIVEAQGVHVYGDVAFVITYAGELVAVNVQDPLAPAILDSLVQLSFDSSWGVVATAGYVFVACGTDVVEAYSTGYTA